MRSYFWASTMADIEVGTALIVVGGNTMPRHVGLYGSISQLLLAEKASALSNYYSSVYVVREPIIDYNLPLCK